MMKEYSFHGQREDEHVVYVIHGHPFVLVLFGRIALSAFLLAFSLWLFWPQFYVYSITLVILSFIYLYRAYHSYKESVFIVTDQRLFKISQSGFFRRKISEVEFKNIQEISTSTNGIIRSIYKFGDLIVRTAGADKDSSLIVPNIPNPYDVQQAIAFLKNNHKLS